MKRVEEAAQNAEAYEQTVKQITDRLQADHPPENELERNTVRGIAAEAQSIPRRERTAAQYRTLLTVALMDRDFGALLRRATIMEVLFEEDGSETDIAYAMFSKAYALGELLRNEEARAAYSALIDRFDKEDTTSLVEQVAGAYLNMGSRLRDLGRLNDAIDAFDVVLRRFDCPDNNDLQERVAAALFNKGVVFGDQGRSGEAIALYDKVIKRFEHQKTPFFEERVAKAMVNQTSRLLELEENEEAIVAADLMLNRFANRRETYLERPIATALFNKACGLAKLYSVDRAIQTLKKWCERLGHFDCDQVANDTDFDRIREHPDFVQLLGENGCDCGTITSDTTADPDPDTPAPKESDEAAGPIYE